MAQNNSPKSSPNSSVNTRIRYLLIGDGRLAKHLSHYFHNLGIEHSRWARKMDSQERLKSLLQNSDVVMIAISDTAIAEFAQLVHKMASDHTAAKAAAPNTADQKKTLIHFSGLQSFEGIHGFHPLASFTQALWDESQYRDLCFVSEKGGASFSAVFPGLSNPSFSIEKSAKPLYHALAALAGNGSVLLWNKFLQGLEELGLPKEVAFPYIQSVTRNLLSDGPQALTGPISRNDSRALSIHKRELKDDPYWNVYEALIAAAAPNLHKEIT